MESFRLEERPKDKIRNRIIIASFIVFTFIVSYVIYNSVVYGLSKINFGTYDAGANVSNLTGMEVLKTLNVKCGDNHNFKTYIAKDNTEKEKGLSVFNKIRDDESMIFVFDTPSRYSFWMKDMKFPIDIVWLNQEGKINYIASNISPNTYPTMIAPPEDSLYVLEFNAGTMKKMKIKIGDACFFDLSLLN